MSGTPGPIALLPSIAPLAATADAWISDIWGVLHNGLVAFPAAGDACVRFRETGGTVVLVTNAPRPAASVARMLARLGVPRQAYDAIVTSGDAARGMIDARPTVPLFHLGPARMAGIFAGIEDRLGPADAAALVVCTGLFADETEQPDDYRVMLEDLVRRRVPLICANPDIVVERGHKLVPCAGALAAIYAALGGEVLYAGKPHAPIYAEACREIAAARGAMPPKDRILAVGDGLKTDIEGAGRAGLRSVFIASALHVAAGQTLDAALLAELFRGHAHPPVAAMPALAW